MSKTTFKEKSMKKRSLVIKEASNRQHQIQGRNNHTHNPPKNFPQHQTHQKGGCTRLFKEQLRMYSTFGQKFTYTEKAVVKSRPRVKPIKGSVNG